MQAKTKVTSIDVRNCKRLKHVDFESIMMISGLRSLECTGCPELKFPPHEIAALGGEQVVRFYRDRKFDLAGSQVRELPCVGALIRVQIHEIDLTGCKFLVRLPVEELLEIRALRTIHCKDCDQLEWPPKIVTADGGEEVMRFLRTQKLDLRGRNFETFPSVGPLMLGKIVEIDVTDCLMLRYIPVVDICRLPYLQSFVCQNCTQLKWPPKKVLGGNGAEVLEFLRRGLMVIPKDVTIFPVLNNFFSSANIQVIDMTDNEFIRKIPIENTSNLLTLRSIECAGCSSLVYPPDFIKHLGGEAVLSLLRDHRLVFANSDFEELPEEIETLQQSEVKEIDLRHCRNLKHLPVQILNAIGSLQSLLIAGCTALKFPPHQVAARGGVATMK